MTLPSINQFGKYLGNIAREVRDIPTAIGTSAKSVTNPKWMHTANPGTSSAFDMPTQNFKTQISDVIGAVKGRIGSPSDTYSKPIDKNTSNYNNISGGYSPRKGAYTNGGGEVPQPTTNTFTGKTTYPKTWSSSTKSDWNKQKGSGI
jgi:hypothetical protein